MEFPYIDILHLINTQLYFVSPLYVGLTTISFGTNCMTTTVSFRTRYIRGTIFKTTNKVLRNFTHLFENN